MIVRDFLQWIRTAPASERAEATSALARAYLYSDLSPDDLGAAEGAMLMLLDDPSPLVRRALADALAASPSAPPAIILALAADQPQLAAPVYALSPLFVDADLVDAVATGGAAIQAAIASRAALPRAVAAAIAEVGTAESCLVLVENFDCDIAPFSIDRIVERFGHLAAIREALLAREDIPAATRQPLVAQLSEALAELADMPVARVSALVHDRGTAGLRALFEKAQLPPSTYPAFREAIEAMREGLLCEPGGATRLKRRMIERVLTRCENEDVEELAPLLTLLRRFATEAAREEARLLCDELVADDLDGRSAAA